MVLFRVVSSDVLKVNFIVLLLIIPLVDASEHEESKSMVNESETLLPTVAIAILVRNKAFSLPYFLSSLEQLDYPKNRISLWIRSDHNEDESLTILRHWLKSVEDNYHSVNAEFLSSPPKKFSDELGPTNWSSLRFLHIIRLREEALNYARNLWADNIWMLDSDVFFVNNQTLRNLVEQDLTIAAPMLRSDGLYSNYWCGMSEDFYYIRTDDYKPILNRDRIGCFPVVMVHSAVLINLRHKTSENLTYVDKKIPGYNGPEDDIITFALGAKHFGVPLHICNIEEYGYVTSPLEEDQPLEMDEYHLTNIKLEAIAYHNGLPLSEDLSRFVVYPSRDTVGLDEVYMINLVRRPDRRHRMRSCFRELGIQATEIDAVDGRLLNDSIVQEMGIQMLPEYEDPYHKRPLTMGEIGCFLSHYTIWKDMVDRGLRQVMVLEDDIRFEPFFRTKLLSLLNELSRLNINWDLVYLGRKRLKDEDEPLVTGSQQLVWAGYSYWTLGYLLSQTGARKLMDAEPLSKLVPVDEFLPLLFNKHPEIKWKTYFPRRDLVGLSAYPLLVFPTHYTGEPGYVSDTEDSSIIVDVLPPSPTARDDL